MYPLFIFGYYVWLGEGKWCFHPVVGTMDNSYEIVRAADERINISGGGVECVEEEVLDLGAMRETS